MSTRHTLLSLLSAGPSHGYALKRQHDAYFPLARPLAYGQVYTTLRGLLQDGLVIVEGSDCDGGPARTLYRRTDEGTREIARWSADVTTPAPFVTNEIFAKLVVSILAGAAGRRVHDSELKPDAATYLRAQHHAHSERVREITELKELSGSDLATALAAEYALVHLEADLQWIATAASHIDSLTVGISASSRLALPATSGRTRNAGPDGSTRTSR
ncbi:PadR family transcriptional regulator [Streptomyces sp. NBC_00304]|uniref:PadR family transcriptional regulator n=1 Tax=Streptomyces sp. NBC_00304 TaxID=2975706 RepID=UPI002E2E7458|nr:PadR family transcriptional regulator [Streptomyces sp. NBC_00304]